MSEKVSIGIRAVGSYMPQQERTILSPEGDSVTVRTSGPEETTYQIGAWSLQDMARRAGVELQDLENQYHFFCNDSYGDYLIQMLGRQVLDRAGLNRVVSFNLNQGSNSALLGLKMLTHHLRGNDVRYASLSAPQVWEYHSENRLLGDAVMGDGSVSLLLEKGYDRYRFLSFATKTVGKYHDILYNEVGGWKVPIAEEPCREGRFVYKVHNREHYQEVKETTLDHLEEVIAKALQKAGTDWDELGKVVIHSPTPSLHRRFLERFGLAEEQVIDSGLRYGYMCSAGMMLSLQTLVCDTDLEKGTRVLAASFGLDGNWAAAVLEV